MLGIGLGSRLGIDPHPNPNLLMHSCHITEARQRSVHLVRVRVVVVSRSRGRGRGSGSGRGRGRGTVRVRVGLEVG